MLEFIIKKWGYLRLDPPEVGLETRIWIRMVYLWDDSRKHRRRIWKWGSGGKEANTGALMRKLCLWETATQPWWGALCRAHPQIFPHGWWGAGILSASSHLSLGEGCWHSQPTSLMTEHAPAAKKILKQRIHGACSKKPLTCTGMLSIDSIWTEHQ